MMDPSSVHAGGVEHVLHQHGDLGSVDPHMGVLSLPGVHSHHVLSQQVPLGGYMHPAHSLSMPPPVHIVPNPVSQVSLTGSPYVHPGLMQEQTEKYGPLLFHKDDQGLYTCFFTGCGKKLKANFSRHVAKHEMDGDKMDPNLATQIQTSSASKNLGTTKVSFIMHLSFLTSFSHPNFSLTTTHICSHPTHQEWWGTSAEQPVTEFYKRCSKCKKCYIRLQQESKRQRLSLEGLSNNSPMAPPVMLQPPYGADMFPMGHVNTLPMLDHHLKRDDIDDEQGPSKRMRIEESASLMASLQELTYKHFKEMAELTARHSAHSRKLIAENTAVRMAAELRHTKDKEDLEVKFKNQWDQFRYKCLREREDLYQAQLVALNRELNGATIPVRPCRLCTKRIYSTFLYQCNLCNEEACIRCQAVMVCGVCGTKSCENCTIKHNWLIWCNRCHKTFCSNHRSISDDICPGCDAQKGVDMMMHPQHLTQHLHDLDHPQHLHHSHSDYDHDLPIHHHSNHHHSEELMGQHLKFEDIDNPHHPHSHSHELSNQHLHMDSHLHHDHHLQHEHMQHMQHEHMPHEHLHHEHMQHHLQHDHNDHHHHYQDQQYELQHIPPHDHMPSDLSDHHHHHQQQYEQNYPEQDYHEQSIHHEQQSEEIEHQQHEQPQQNYQEQNYEGDSPSSHNGLEQQNGQDGPLGEQQTSEQQNEQEQGSQGTPNAGEGSQEYLQGEQHIINDQQTTPESPENNKYDELPSTQSSSSIHKASLIR